MMRHYGIVLHCFPQKYKIALIDNTLGRVDAIVRSNTVMLGALITYEIEYKRNAYFAQAIRIEDAPLTLAQSDILFLHHVLEICYYFMPVASCSEGIFDLLQFMYKPSMEHVSMQNKKMLLFKILSTLGIHASVQDEQEHVFFNQLKGASIDTVSTQELDLKYEKELDRWLLYCMAEYADMQVLKTIHFLIKSRVV